MKSKKTCSLSLFILSLLCIYLALTYVSLSFLAKNEKLSNISSRVLKAESASVFDQRLNFQMELRKNLSREKIGIFDSQCSPLYVSDLSLNLQSCQNRTTTYYWENLSSPKDDYIISFNKKHLITDFWADHSELILVTTSIYFFIITAFILIVFFTLIDAPIRSISFEIDRILNGHVDKLFKEKKHTTFITDSLYEAISKLVDVFSNHEKEKAILDLSRQVSHDIRSPLEALKLISLNSDLMAPDSKTIILKSIERISKIASELLQETSPQNNDAINIYDLASELCADKKHELGIDILLQNESLEDEVFTVTNENALYRVLSNLINNAFEASVEKQSEVAIRISNSEGYIFIKVIDKGIGISEDDIKKAKEGGFTTKENGNGLGLSSSIKAIHELGGTLDIDSSIGEGTTITIRLFKFNRKEKAIVLIDNDFLVHQTWQLEAKKKNIKITTFFSIEDFMKNKDAFDKDVLIYIDSDLGENISGELASEEIAKEGFSELYLSTGYQKDSIYIPPWIKGVIGKKLPSL